MIFLEQLDFLLMHFRGLKVIELLGFQLLLQYILHNHQTLLLFALVIVLSSEEGRSSIQISIDKSLVSFYFVFMIVYKSFLRGACPQTIIRLISYILKRPLIGITGRLCGAIIYQIALAHLIALFYFPLFPLLLKLNSPLQLVVIDAFKCIFVVQTGVVCYLDLFNEPWINLLPHELLVVFGESIVRPIYFSDLFHIKEEYKEEQIRRTLEGSLFIECIKSESDKKATGNFPSYFTNDENSKNKNALSSAKIVRAYTILYKLKISRIGMAERLRQLKETFVFDPLEYLNLTSMIPERQRALIKKVEQFGQRYLKRQQIDDCVEKAIFPKFIVEPLQQLDIGKYFIPKPYGEELSLIAQGLIIASVAQYDLSVSTFLFLQLPLSGRTLFKLGSQQQKEKYLRDIIGLKKIWGWALTQREVGSNSTRIGTAFTQKDSSLILNGNKRWIGNGNNDFLIVYGNLKEQNSKNKILGVIVDVKSQGLTAEKIQNKLGLRMVQNCQIEFKNVMVPADNLIPGAINYRQGVENVLKHSRVIVIWNAVGGCIGVYKRAIKYAMIKKSFGRLIGGFQLVQEKLVKMMANIQAIILSAWKNTEMYEKDNETSTAKIGMFKAWVTERGRLICSLGRQIMGLDGLLHQNYVMRALLDMQALYTYEGTYDINVLVAGSELTGLKAFV